MTYIKEAAWTAAGVLFVLLMLPPLALLALIAVITNTVDRQ